MILSDRQTQEVVRESKQSDKSFHSFTPDGKQAQNTPASLGESSESERSERVKGPNEGTILDALNASEEEEKPLTVNTIVKKAGLTWRQAEEIEEAAC